MRCRDSAGSGSWFPPHQGARSRMEGSPNNWNEAIKTSGRPVQRPRWRPRISRDTTEGLTVSSENSSNCEGRNATVDSDGDARRATSRRRRSSRSWRTETKPPRSAGPTCRRTSSLPTANASGRELTPMAWSYVRPSRLHRLTTEDMREEARKRGGKFLSPHYRYGPDPRDVRVTPT